MLNFGCSLLSLSFFLSSMQEEDVFHEKKWRGDPYTQDIKGFKRIKFHQELESIISIRKKDTTFKNLVSIICFFFSLFVLGSTTMGRFSLSQILLSNSYLRGIWLYHLHFESQHHFLGLSISFSRSFHKFSAQLNLWNRNIGSNTIPSVMTRSRLI